MAIAKILASVTGGVRDEAVLRYAVAVARPFSAHVVAIFVRPDLAEAIAFFSDGVSGAVIDEVISASRDAAEEAARRVEQTLSAVCTKEGVESVSVPARADRVTLSFHQAQGNLSDQMTQAARLSDIVVFGPLQDGDNNRACRRVRSDAHGNRSPGATSYRRISTEFYQAHCNRLGWQEGRIASRKRGASLSNPCRQRRDFERAARNGGASANRCFARVSCASWRFEH